MPRPCNAAAKTSMPLSILRYPCIMKPKPTIDRSGKEAQRVRRRFESIVAIAGRYPFVTSQGSASLRVTNRLHPPK